jgi:hypothetical protein
MGIKDRAKKIVDSIMGRPAAMGDHMPFVKPSRKQRRIAAARTAAIPRRRKYEKRGAPGRSSKGRKPFRVS